MNKLGKLPAKDDRRTLRLRSYIEPTLDVPETFCTDWRFMQFVPNRMFRNDILGCCVISARANQSLRFELRETDTLPEIDDAEVEREYFKESGGQDTGLYMLDSLKAWRSQGWEFSWRTYVIHAFGAVDFHDEQLVKAAIYLCHGIQVGFSVPQSCIDQFNSDQIWTPKFWDGGIVGGHAIYVMDYDRDGVTCMTWGRRQRMSWPFWHRYVDEAYAVVDSRNPWLGEPSPLDIEQLEADLQAVTGG